MDLSWKYSDKHSPAAPVMPLTLRSFSIEAVVDTGFGGGLLIPFPLFETLGLLSALTPDERLLVLPDSTRLELYTARDEVGVGSDSIKVEVHSSPSVDRRLVGRGFLRSFVAALDGEEEELTVRRIRPRD